MLYLIKLIFCFGDNLVIILIFLIVYFVRIEWVNILRNCKCIDEKDYIFKLWRNVRYD